MVGLQPLHQRTAGMERDLDLAEFFKDIEKRQIAVLICGLENVVEISDRLVVVQNQTQLNFWIAHVFRSLSTTLGEREGAAPASSRALGKLQF